MNNVQTYIVPYMKKYKKLMATTVLLGLLAILSAAMLTFTSGFLISKTSLRPETILLVYVPIVAVRAFGISRAVLRYLERLVSHDAVLKILSDMRVALYRALEPQALFIRSRFKTGDLLGTLSDDIEHLQDVYIRTVFPTLIGLFLFAFAIVTLSIFDWLFGLFLAICLGIIVFVYPMLSLNIMKKRQLQAKELHSKLYATLTDAIFGIRDWISSGRTNELSSNFMKASKESFQAKRKLTEYDQSRTFQMQLISAAIVIIVGVWAGLKAGEGVIMPVYIAAFTLVVIPIVEALMPISHAVERIPHYDESLKRLEAIDQHSPEVQTEQEENKLLRSIDIRLDSVSYRYSNEQADAVHNISLSIPQGRKIAILGKSGAGKSTLMQMLLGTLQPTNGKITLNGKEAALKGDRIFDQIGVLEQKPYLFATTVANNIKLGNASATMEEIEKVIGQVGLTRYMQSLPKGLHTQMEETGQRFSGGERQRIALSRILLKDTPVVILDEPTVGLDPETENALIETIFDALAGKTIIWITHHLSGMEKMDSILFMEEGSIVMEGSHDELLATNTRYRKLYELDKGL